MSNNEEKVMENEKYPQIILGTDNVYQVLIAPGVEVKFDSTESVEDFCKNKNFIIKGEYVSPRDDRKDVSKRRLMRDLTNLQ